MLQRIYGTVWATQEELDQYLHRREEAKKRDHRKLGVQLDLYSFHDVSPGSAFWHPKGQRIWRTLESAMRELQERRGYDEVSTPIVVSERLWRQSGHWDHYAENMFIVESEGQKFSLKPMNCPESTLIYRSHLRSYRDLPLRYNEYGRLHRNERSGALSGLTRVRQFIQDDGHIYVRPDQLTDELEALLGEVHEAYGWFGLQPRFAFATRPDKAIGDPALWDLAEGLIKETLDKVGGDYMVKPKDGTFYAPKIDIYIDDALGREWQMATIQIDLTMLPERFDLTYIDEDGQAKRPMAIHRAIYGSLERFIGILVEHFAGAFPLWIAPVQAVVIPIADRHVEPARELAGELRAGGLRFVEVDASDNRMQNKIRLAQGQKVPYMLILGDREVEARTAAVRRRGGAKDGPQEVLASARRSRCPRCGGPGAPPGLIRPRGPARRQVRRLRPHPACRSTCCIHQGVGAARLVRSGPLERPSGRFRPCPARAPSARAGGASAASIRCARPNARAILPRLSRGRLSVRAAHQATGTKGTPTSAETCASTR